MPTPLLEVDNLHTYFQTPRGVSRAVDGVSFSLNAGETLAIVGESGCGKSMTALSILQLVPEPAGYIDTGRILFEGNDLLDLTWDQMRSVRGKDIAMIFQEPMTSLNAVFTIGWQIRETILLHGTAKGLDAENRAIELLRKVGIDNPEVAMRQYPHELSGGMRQRAMIAMALANNPKLLIADEPTTALDVTIQAQILDLMRDLQQEFRMAILLITHDLGIVARMANSVAVMYAGQVVENAPTQELFREPKHPYTRGLFASLPTRTRRGRDLETLEGVVPQPTNWPPACRFEPRCRLRWGSCATIPPRYAAIITPNPVRCHLYDPQIPDRPAPGAKAAEEALLK
ncbi:MAG TPA: ABC transporter ATP-binding protein [Chthonomonadaceae bacterium]|nr:ABC transporter ATP-binding protein [Chthonomonadaceae bacterium]